jgi:hypothetical protein
VPGSARVGAPRRRLVLRSPPDSWRTKDGLDFVKRSAPLKGEPARGRENARFGNGEVTALAWRSMAP